MSVSKSLCIKWKGNEGSQLSSLMLKSPVIIKKFWIFTSVFLRYFKADLLESE